MQLFIKNMVCDRCVMAVQKVMEAQGLEPVSIQLGEVKLAQDNLDAAPRQQLAKALADLGFELMDDKRSRLIEKIKNTIIRLVHHSDEPSPYKFSERIAQELSQDYAALSRLFSEVEGMTIEQYILLQKTERVKEYLVYDELTLSAIADKMGYSSVAHLSGQFRKLTGMTPTEFKKRGPKNRSPLDKVGGAA